MKINANEQKRLQGIIAELRSDRLPFWNLWREVANYFLPKRYVWLQSDKEARIRNAKNPYILDSTGTTAARILASGMMNGITSPSRPWFRLRIAGFEHEGDAVAIWADEVVRRMLFVMSESNFYNAMAVLYLDLVIFGTGANLIYEDDETVIRCYNPALGEYYLSQNQRLAVDTFAREFKQSVKQLAKNFGEENLSATLQTKYKSGGQQCLHLYDVTHLVEPNYSGSSVPSKFRYVEMRDRADEYAPPSPMRDSASIGSIAGVAMLGAEGGVDIFGLRKPIIVLLHICGRRDRSLVQRPGAVPSGPVKRTGIRR